MQRRLAHVRQQTGDAQLDRGRLGPTQRALCLVDLTSGPSFVILPIILKKLFSNSACKLLICNVKAFHSYLSQNCPHE